jgi:hypothetical protein
MPYLPSSARNKSDYYQKILDADKIEQQKLIRDLRNRQDQSGSIDANKPLRDENGFLTSVELPEQTLADTDTTQRVRLENKQPFFNSKFSERLNEDFTFFKVGSKTNEELDLEDEKEEIKVEIKKEDIKVGKIEIPLRQQIVEFVNRYNNESNPTTISTNKLNSKLTIILQKRLNPTKTNTFGILIGSFQGLMRLKMLILSLNYKGVYQEYIATSPELDSIWKGVAGNSAEQSTNKNYQDDLEEMEGKGLV